MTVVLRTDALGDLDVRSMTLRLFERRNWTATVLCASEALPPEGDPARLLCYREDGTADVFVGVVRRRALKPGTVDLSVTIVGGAGKLLAPEIGAQHHASGTGNVPAGLVVASIVADAGEALAAGVVAELDAIPLPQWTRYAGSASAALDVAAGVLGFVWRMLADGTVWAGAETWPIVDASADYWTGRPEDGVVLYATDGAPYRPGTTIDGARAVEVMYYFDAEGSAIQHGMRCEVRVEQPGDPVYLPPLDPYRAPWPGTVRAQDGDGGKLQIACDSPVIGDTLREIPIRVGLPGCTVTVPEGTRVRVRFEGGDPRGCYAGGDIDEEDATQPLALVDDATDSGYISAVAPAAPGDPIIFVHTPAGQPPPPNATPIPGIITGPGHKYVKGVSG